MSEGQFCFAILAPMFLFVCVFAHACDNPDSPVRRWFPRRFFPEDYEQSKVETSIEAPQEAPEIRKISFD